MDDLCLILMISFMTLIYSAAYRWISLTTSLGNKMDNDLILKYKDL